jgi:hypothetical protein
MSGWHCSTFVLAFNEGIPPTLFRKHKRALAKSSRRLGARRPLLGITSSECAVFGVVSVGLGDSDTVASGSTTTSADDNDGGIMKHWTETKAFAHTVDDYISLAQFPGKDRAVSLSLPLPSSLFSFMELFVAAFDIVLLPPVSILALRLPNSVPV